MAQPDRRRRPAARAHRQPQFRQSRAARNNGRTGGLHQGVGEAARALDFPVVSGNVSLYNETMGAGIPPTPAIAGVGVVDDVGEVGDARFKVAETIFCWIGGAPSSGSAGRNG